MIDNFKRVQHGLKLIDLYPSQDGLCACGCGEKLTGRQKRWASELCSTLAYEQFAIIKGNTGIIRKHLFFKQSGFCQSCGVQTSNWEAHHIIPVHNGGGACDISNFNTLCAACHKQKHSKRYPIVIEFPRTRLPLHKSFACMR